MRPAFLAAVHHFLYASGAVMGPVEISLRTIVVYFAAIVIVRLGKKKFMGQYTGLDTLISFILGSILSRGINGSSPLPETVLAGFVLIGVHWCLTFIAVRWRPFSRLMNGRSRRIVRDGVADMSVMRRHGISADDLGEAVRTNAQMDNLSQVHAAYLERSGRISILPEHRSPRVIQIAVLDGVQTIRIEL